MSLAMLSLIIVLAYGSIFEKFLLTLKLARVAISFAVISGYSGSSNQLIESKTSGLSLLGSVPAILCSAP